MRPPEGRPSAFSGNRLTRGKNGNDSEGREAGMAKEEIPPLSLAGTLFREDPALRVFRHPPEMETPRLRLRKLRMRDAEKLFSWMSDPEVARYVLWRAHRTRGETRSYLRYIRSQYRRGFPCSWGLEIRETGELIGTMGVMAWYPDHGCMEVGYSLGQLWWHHGYAAEALECLMDLLFEEGNLNRIEAQCDVRNPNSARVMEKCGMRREGLLRQRIFNKGEPVDVMLYAALAQDRKKEKTGRMPFFQTGEER